MEQEIRAIWPEPLSGAWAAVENAAEDQLLRSVTDANATVMRFIWALAVSERMAVGSQIELDRLSRPSDGHWREALESLLGKKADAPMAVLDDVRRWWRSARVDGKSVGVAFDELVSVRNRSVHEPQAPGPSQRRAANDAKRRLYAILKSMNWVSSLTLFWVESTRVGEEHTSGRVYPLHGDRPLLQPIEARWVGRLAMRTPYFVYASQPEIAIPVDPWIGVGELEGARQRSVLLFSANNGRDDRKPYAQYTSSHVGAGAATLEGHDELLTAAEVLARAVSGAMRRVVLTTPMERLDPESKWRTMVAPIGRGARGAQVASSVMRAPKETSTQRIALVASAVIGATAAAAWIVFGGQDDTAESDTVAAVAVPPEMHRPSASPPGLHEQLAPLYLDPTDLTCAPPGEPVTLPDGYYGGFAPLPERVRVDSYASRERVRAQPNSYVRSDYFYVYNNAELAVLREVSGDDGGRWAEVRLLEDSHQRADGDAIGRTGWLRLQAIHPHRNACAERIFDCGLRTPNDLAFCQDQGVAERVTRLRDSDGTLRYAPHKDQGSDTELLELPAGTAVTEHRRVCMPSGYLWSLVSTDASTSVGAHTGWMITYELRRDGASACCRGRTEADPGWCLE